MNNTHRSLDPDFALVRETHPNPDMVTYHVTSRLSQTGILNFRAPTWNLVRLADMSGLLKLFRFILFGKAGREHEKAEKRDYEANSSLANDLLAIDGIVSVLIDQYSIRMEKGRAFAWPDLEPSIQQVLEKHALK